MSYSVHGLNAKSKNFYPLVYFVDIHFQVILFPKDIQPNFHCTHRVINIRDCCWI